MWFDLGTLVIPVAMEAFALKITNVRIYIEYIQKEPEINTNTNIKTNTPESGKKVKLPLEIQPSSFLQIPTQLKTHKVQQGSRGTRCGNSLAWRAHRTFSSLKACSDG